jgi:hypothetical protein
MIRKIVLLIIILKLITLKVVVILLILKSYPKIYLEYLKGNFFKRIKTYLIGELITL